MFDWFRSKPKLKPPRNSPAALAAKQAAPMKAPPPTAEALLVAEVAAARDICKLRAASATAVLRLWLREDAAAPPNKS